MPLGHFSDMFMVTNFHFFIKILFIYSGEREREKQAPCREPDMGLDPGTPGPGPGPKAGATPLSHLGGPSYHFLT